MSNNPPPWSHPLWPISGPLAPRSTNTRSWLPTDPKPAKTASKKRTATTAALDNDTPFVFDPDLRLGPMPHPYNTPYKYSCNQIRSKLRALIETGEYKITALQNELDVNSNSWGRFMKYKDPWQGIDNQVFEMGHEFILQFEAAGKKVQRKKTKTDAVAERAIESVVIPGEEIGRVAIYDTCDDIRRKINAYLREPGITQAGLSRELSKVSPDMDVTARQLTAFLKKKGGSGGADSPVFLSAYMLFEKMRIAQGKPKSKKREEMERLWGAAGVGRRDHFKKGFWAPAGMHHWENEFGQLQSQAGGRAR